ncbi:hypothetical protein PDR89_09970 [Bacillus cereus group sp. Bc002]|uniref:hypothetical protein n=1 Tax=Bacillus cereus group sp. Bc002 TaxID=3018130 RepID=UPI0022E75258|nr:hypothetical protein [Bacillus cereus group sp. Bc002]MDA2779787.1 hypothetical protein [Bacillus cereus group sp. Bc002]
MKTVSDLLFVPQYSKERLNPNFLSIYNERLPFAKDVIRGWAEGFEDRDNKFVQQFQLTFNSSFWELYLFAVLKELNLEVNMTYDRPDFVIEGENGFVIEATIASHPGNGIPEWEKDFSRDTLEEWPLEKIIDNATLRIANSFIGKSRHYKKSYDKLNHVQGKPFVLAIAPFDSPYTNEQRMQAIHRVLYGFDRHIAIDWDEYNRDILGTIYMNEIDKTKDAKVPLGYFTTPEFSHISAVIFSNTATFSKVRVMSDDPRITLVSSSRYNDFGTQANNRVTEKREYEEHLLDGLIVFHNPFASVPFNNKSFYHPVIAHSTFDINKKENISHIPHDFLFQRYIFTFGNENIQPPLELILEARKELEKVMENNQNKFPKFHD